MALNSDALNSPDYWSLQTNSSNGLNFSDPLFNISTEFGNCLIIEYKDFVPWNNPDNIVSADMEDITRRVTTLLFLPFATLIGCPANIINMIIFYKQGLKERINVCLFSLSLADLLYLLNNFICFAEQFQLHFTTRERYGPVNRFMANNHLIIGHGFIWVSQVLSAIIACERCFCIMQPLRSQLVLRTSTMSAIIIGVYVFVIGLTFVIMTRYEIKCTYDPFTGKAFPNIAPGEFFLRHETLVVHLDVFIFGAGLPGFVIIGVTTSTIITMRKLRQAAEWRAGTSSGGSISEKELALTKMLVANSIFFIACVFPFVVFRVVFLIFPEMSNGRRRQNFYMMVQWVLIIISYFNSTFNFVVYYTMGSRYRQTFWQLFGKTDTKEKPGKIRPGKK